jgi:hypothetical protein
MMRFKSVQHITSTGVSHRWLESMIRSKPYLNKTGNHCHVTTSSMYDSINLLFNVKIHTAYIITHQFSEIARTKFWKVMQADVCCRNVGRFSSCELIMKL